MPPQYAICKDGFASITSKGQRDFLLESPRGPYTVMRTIEKGLKIACFVQHLRRLALSSHAMSQGELDLSPLGNLLLQQIRVGILRMPVHDGEYRILVILPNTGSDCHSVWIHISPLYSRESSSVVVEAVKGCRTRFGAVKDTMWATVREELEAAKQPNTDEVLLVNDEGQVLEGLSSNIFVVSSTGVVETAPVTSKILAGTIRELLLSACKKENIKIVEKVPLWVDRLKWKGAFLTSTSRLVLPIHEIIDKVSGENEAKTARFDSIPAVVHRCMRVLQGHISESSHDIGKFFSP